VDILDGPHMPPLILYFMGDGILDQLEVAQMGDLAQLSCLPVAQILVQTGLGRWYDIAPRACHIFGDKTS